MYRSCVCPKDVFLVSEMAIFIRGERVDILLTLIFSISISSILLPLPLNILTVIKFKRWSKVKKVFGSIFIILVPATIKYRLYRLKLQYRSELQEEESPRLDKLLELRANIDSLDDLLVELRANENSTEHILQLVLPLLLIFIRDPEHMMSKK